MSAIKKPIRMCVICKERFHQKSLYRFHFTHGELRQFAYKGRSIYFCPSCLNQNHEKLLRTLNGKLKIKNKKIEDFGEHFSKCVHQHNKEKV